MRLTERIIDENGVEHIFTKYVKDNQKLKDQKLCALEDIEDELGIDLVALFKALKNGVFAKTKQGIQKLYCRHFTLCNFEATTNRKWGDIKYFYHTYHYKDYGKTWALTKEELL